MDEAKGERTRWRDRRQERSEKNREKKKETKINFNVYSQTPINASNCVTKTFVKQYAVRRNIGFGPRLFLSAFDTAAKIKK